MKANSDVIREIFWIKVKYELKLICSDSYVSERKDWKVDGRSQILKVLKSKFSAFCQKFLGVAVLSLSCGTQALCCCLQAFSRWAISRFRAQASPCRSFSHFRAWGLGHVGSVVVSQGLSCSMSCGIFLDNGSNPCPLHWQVNS